MSLTEHALRRTRRRDHDRGFAEGGIVDQGAADPRIASSPGTGDDALVVTCAACGTQQRASGYAPGYTCHTCGSVWRVLRCRGCRHASVVLEGAVACPRCGCEHRGGPRPAGPRLPTWLNEPDPLSVWFGGVKYLGGHAERDQPVTAAGLLLDRRGIHLRAFAELFTIPWPTVRGLDIEDPHDISERLTTTRLVDAGASTWAMRVAYLTVHTTKGDAIFEIDGLGPPQLHARLSRVLQGLDQAEDPPGREPIEIERGRADSRTPAAAPAHHEPLAIDPEKVEAPLEVLIIDALWKLAQLHEAGLLDDAAAQALRARVLARIP